MIARFSVAAALAGFALLATGVAHSQDAKDKPKLGSMRLVVVLKDKEISLKEKQYPLVIVFQSTTFKEQRFKRSEYFFAVLDKHGVQVENAVFLDDEDKEIVLKAGRTEDTPKVVLNPHGLQAGQEYQLICVVRNLASAVKFTAKE